MKAFLHISNNTNKNMIRDFLLAQLDMYKCGIFDIEEIEIENTDLIIPANNKSTFDNVDIESKKEIIYKKENITKNDVNSYLVFKDIFNIGNEIEKSLNIDDDIKTIMKNNEYIKYNFYKQAIKNMLKRKNNLHKFIFKITPILERYGIIETFNPNTQLTNICNVLELLVYSYFIYECYHLYYCLQDYMEIDLKLFNFYTNNLTRENTFKYIDDTISFLENQTSTSCYFKSNYNKENERWDTILIFENALQLTIYELRTILSKDANDENIGICKYCKTPFERIGIKKKTCDDYECIRIRQNNRKKKSNQNKKSLST